MLGRLSADETVWKPDDPRLVLAAEYTIDAVALDGDGRRVARHATFTTFFPTGASSDTSCRRTARPWAPE